MKKITLAIAAIACLTGCKKNYTCTCVDANPFDNVEVTGSVRTFEGLSKSEAEDLQFDECPKTKELGAATCTWAQE
jgi:hypothetical protein